jgi:hypothetical protein
MKKIAQPNYTEHALYYEKFIALVDPNISVLQQLKDNAKLLNTWLLTLLPTTLVAPYAPHKWTPQQVLQHLIDVERNLLYRAASFSRNDKEPKPFFDENEYIEQSIANLLPLKKLLKEYTTLRQNTIAFFQNQNNKTLLRTGYASNTAMSVRACAWIICGHEIHHINVLQQKLNLTS